MQLFKAKETEAGRKISERQEALDSAIPEATVEDHEDAALDATMTMRDVKGGTRQGRAATMAASMLAKKEALKAKSEQMASELAMKSADGILDQITPHAMAALGFYRQYRPVYDQYAAPTVNRVSEFVFEWDLHELVPALFGFILAFFGSRFALCIAGFEAFMQVGYTPCAENFAILCEQLERLAEEERLDSMEDLDGDGIPDAEQIDDKEFVKRKIMLLIKHVDPEPVRFLLLNVASTKP